MKIYEVFVVARRVCLELSLRYFLPIASRNWNFVPVVMKIYGVGESLTDWEKCSRRLVVFRLQNDEKRTVFVYHGAFLGTGCPAYISTTGRVILVKVIQFRHQLPSADGVIRRIERHGHVPGTCVTRTGTAGIEDGMRNSA